MAQEYFADHRLTTSRDSFDIGSTFRKWWQSLKACYSYTYEEPVIQHYNQETNYGFHQHENEDDEVAHDKEENPVWQKNILMGGKCQLPDFSGVIIYDSEGNVVTPAKTILALPWK